jgi:hypothetical protein
MITPLLDFTDSSRVEFATRPLVSRHRIHQLDLFGDDELAALLERYPRERLQAFTMGTDPCRRDDWHFVDVADVPGKDILAAVFRGRLWLNLLRVDLADARYAEVIRQLTTELKGQCPALGLHSINFGTLLISSPQAMVYYHFDSTHQALWHMRGRKRIWLYPAGDERFASRQTVEEIFAGTYDYDEEIPYSPDFDRHARVFDLDPGDVVSWPHSAPHRVENLGSLNVSLSTGFLTEAAERRHQIYVANHLVRRRLGIRPRSTRETGVVASAKALMYRVCRRAGLLAKRPGRHEYPRSLRIDPEASLGFRRVET